MSQDFLLHIFHDLHQAFEKKIVEFVKYEQISWSLLHLRALRLVAVSPLCPLQLIAEQLDRDKAQITRLVKELESSGIVIKLPHPSDKRSQILQLTEAGQSLHHKMQSIETRVKEMMLMKVTEQDQLAVQRTVKAMTQNLLYRR